MRLTRTAVALVALFVASVAVGRCEVTRAQVERAVATAVRPLMAQDAIPGAAVGIVYEGRPYEFYYGVASERTMHPVTANTLFEVGSITKTFTATLAAYASLEGKMSLSDPVSAYLPSLRGTTFGTATLLDLGTHTAGTLPLQVPDSVTNDSELLSYLAKWRSANAPGTVRVYSNVGIGALGLITARRMGMSFASLTQAKLLAALGLRSTYIDVPQAKMADYAQGYTRSGKPIRMAPGELWEETYGIRTTAPDLVRYLEANMGLISVEPALRRAIFATHTGYVKAGVMTQDLMWEQYAYPVALKTLLAGTAMLGETVPAKALIPVEPPNADVLLNKTGSTNGFAAYVAFVPEKRLGIVLLANRSIALSQRVTVAYRILRALGQADPRPHLVDVGGGRRMNIHCTGSGSPAVILDSGLGVGSEILSWNHVQPAVATFTRVCSYDRAGYGLSDPGPLPRDSNAVVRDLHALLQRAGIAPPYILVGHSIAGLYEPLFADRYPSEVSAMVLVDPSVSGQEELVSREYPKYAAFERQQGAWLRQRVAWRDSASEFDSLSEDFAEVNRARRSYGNMPLVVLTAIADEKRMQKTMGATDAEVAQVQAGWIRLHNGIAALSRRGVNCVVPGSGHFIQIDRPKAVVDAIREVIELTHSTARPSCR